MKARLLTITDLETGEEETHPAWIPESQEEMDALIDEYLDEEDSKSE